MQRRNSRQRQEILAYLKGTYSHPTAEQVYESVRVIIPEISLGTVYRNLGLMVGEGEAVKITTPQNKERFDANVNPHYHAVCSVCGNVSDINIPYDASLDKKIFEVCEFRSSSHETVFSGVCKNCGDKLPKMKSGAIQNQ